MSNFRPIAANLRFTEMIFLVISAQSVKYSLEVVNTAELEFIRVVKKKQEKYI